MSKEERDSHNSKAYVAALRKIAEMRPDQGHEAIRQAREILGMENDRYKCHLPIEYASAICHINGACGASDRDACIHWRKY